MGQNPSKPPADRRRRRFFSSAAPPPPPPPPLHAHARSGDWDALLTRLRTHPHEACIPIDDNDQLHWWRGCAGGGEAAAAAGGRWPTRTRPELTGRQLGIVARGTNDAGAASEEEEEEEEDCVGGDDRSGAGGGPTDSSARDDDDESCRGCAVQRSERAVPRVVPRVPRVGLTPLHVVCTHRPPSLVVRSLLKIDPTSSLCMAMRDGGRTPLHLACYSAAPREVVEALLTPVPNSYSSSPFAAVDDQQPVVDPTLALCLQDYYGWTPLHIACRFGASEGIISAMLQGSVTGSRERRARAAGQGRHYRASAPARRALRMGDNAGRTPLHMCCDYFAGIGLDDFARIAAADAGVCWLEDGAAGVGDGDARRGREGGEVGLKKDYAPRGGRRRQKMRRRSGLLPLECLCREYRSVVERAEVVIAKWPWMPPSAFGLARSGKNKQQGSLGRPDARYRRSLGSGSLGGGGEEEEYGGDPNLPGGRDDDNDNNSNGDDADVEHFVRIGRLFQGMDELCEFYGKARILVQAMFGAAASETGECEEGSTGSTADQRRQHDGQARRRAPSSMLHGCLDVEDCPAMLTWFTFLMDPWQARVRDEDGNTPLHVAAAAAYHRYSVTLAYEEEEEEDEGECDNDILTLKQPSGMTILATEEKSQGKIFDSWGDTSRENERDRNLLIEALIDQYPNAASMPNGSGHLPLQIITGAAAGRSGGGNSLDRDDAPRSQRPPAWNDGVGAILLSWPQALESLELADYLYPRVMSRFTSSLATSRTVGRKGSSTGDEKNDSEQDDYCGRLTSLYFLLRERPNVVKTR